ncbi:MAG: hypothetical protein ACI841_001888, partial [Planctomycetota bacterium]
MTTLSSSLLLALAFLATLAWECQAGSRSQVAPEAETAPRPSAHLMIWLRGQSDQLAADLERVHTVLLERAHREQVELVSRLETAPPRANLSGYGVIPTVRKDGAYRTVEPREWTYSLKPLSTGFAPDFRDAAVLAARCEAEPGLALEAAVVEFERLRKDMRRLEEHLSYHEWWQVAIAKDAKYFKERNEVIALVQQWLALRGNAEQVQQAAELRREALNRVAPFEAAGLSIVTGETGDSLMLVPVHTDIEDKSFLEQFEQAIEVEWNASIAMLAAKLRVAIRWNPIPASELYPEGVPSQDAFDLNVHLKLFPEGGMILTTGADSTHAWRGRSIPLGPNPITSRTLAHE